MADLKRNLSFGSFEIAKTIVNCHVDAIVPTIAEAKGEPTKSSAT